MVVHGHREDFLGAGLADDVFVQDLFDLMRRGQLVAALGGKFFLHLFADDVVAQFYALVADEHRRSGDELTDFVLALAAE